ncbi:MAG: ABC transporter ATP-binding protein [Erysipelotrichaceae bacterium]|jgi:multiple sugar transport system ATP-binding protein
MKVKVKNLTKRFGDVTAVKSLTAEFESGKLIALLGPSGCGKTTMLNMLSGILPVTEGQIFFDDKDVTDLTPDKREVGLVFQNYALYPHMTVLENICFPLKIKKVPKAERISKAREFARMVHIEEYLNRKPKELSGGQQQRVAIARALVKNPKLLLLDEPLSNLDAKLRVEMREEIRRIQRESGVTTFFVTHDQEEASAISDYIMLMKLGEMQQYDKSRNLYNQPANLFVADFIGSPTINQLHGIYTEGGIKVDGDNQIIKTNHKWQVDERARVILASRAEALTFNADDKIRSEIVESYLSGKDTLVNLKIGSFNLRGYIDAFKPIKIGDNINIGFKKEGVFLFDELTGERYYE